MSEILRTELGTKRFSWAITGVAGFIGSHLAEALLNLNQQVIGLDDFSTGTRGNLEEVLNSTKAHELFTFLEGSITDRECCREICSKADFVLHEAAIGSVPWSIQDPLRTHDINVRGFLNILIAARDAKVRSVIYASSSAVYGDDATSPNVEDHTGIPLSPYAATKLVNEIYADVFARNYGVRAIGLRYFNIFGARQNPNGPYASVIPAWTAALTTEKTVFINGDGETTRDFCPVANVVQANILAALRECRNLHEVFNIGVGEATSLNELFDHLVGLLSRKQSTSCRMRPQFREFRPGDIRHSVANISKAQRLLGYAPTHTALDGLAESLRWYLAHQSVFDAI